MLQNLVPDIQLSSIYELKPDWLTEKGVKLLLLDLDNTLLPYGQDKAGPRLLNWIASLKKAGIEPFILSNNRGYRPRLLAEQLSLDYIGSAGKPSPGKLLEVLEKKRARPDEAAIVGDQVYTDILCGKRAGILSIAVRPISMKNPLLALRYGLEYPFRRAGRRVT